MSFATKLEAISRPLFALQKYNFLCTKYPFYGHQMRSEHQKARPCLALRTSSITFVRKSTRTADTYIILILYTRVRTIVELTAYA